MFSSTDSDSDYGNFIDLSLDKYTISDSHNFCFNQIPMSKFHHHDEDNHDDNNDTTIDFTLSLNDPIIKERKIDNNNIKMVNNTPICYQVCDTFLYHDIYFNIFIENNNTQNTEILLTYEMTKNFIDFVFSKIPNIELYENIYESIQTELFIKYLIKQTELQHKDLDNIFFTYNYVKNLLYQESYSV
jgi:hypothetical protein